MPINDAPVASDAFFGIDENQGVSVLGPVGATDIDASDTLTYSITAGDADGQFTIDGSTGQLSTTGGLDFEAAASHVLTVTVTDGDGLSDTSTVTVTVNDVNDAPVASGDVAATLEDISVTVDVLGNDSDVDGDVLSAVLETGPASGSVDLSSDGSFTYTPSTNFYGEDSFSYTVSDGVLSDTATVTITVESVNDAPVAVDDSYTTDEDVELTVDVLGNDSDVDGLSLIHI